MKKWAHTFLLAVLAGIAIGIGGTVFLSIENRIVGALMFAVGLYAICVLGLNLYTGKIGALLDNPPCFLWTLLAIWIGNLAGTYLTALALQATRVKGIRETAKAVVEARISDNMGSLVILSIFCGLLVYIAVEGYRRTQNPVILFAAVAAFILCGFEHCIADMFYFSAAGVWSGMNFVRILVITLGNSIGGLLIPAVGKLKEEGNHSV